MDTICLTPEERKRLAALYPPDPEPGPRPRLRALPAPTRHRTGGQRGEQHHGSVLTQELVSEMRLEVAAGASCRDVARKRDLAWGTVVNAVSGRTWGWLKDPPPVVQAKVHLTERICNAMRSNVLVSWRIGDLTKRLAHGSSEHVRAAVHRLMVRGNVERTGRGLYRWASATASSCQDASQA